MENLPWKAIYLAAIFSLITLLTAIYLLTPKENVYFTAENNKKIAEFKNLRIENRKEGKKIWEFFAEKGWTAKDGQTTQLFQVKNGKIYKDRQLVAKGISAPLVITYRRTEVVEASAQPGKLILAQIDLGKVIKKAKSKWVKIKAEKLKYFPQEKIIELSGNISLFSNNFRIFVQKMKIDLEKNISELFDGVAFQRKNGTINSDFLRYLAEEEKIVALGKVNLNLQEGKIKTLIRCQEATFYDDPDKDIQLLGNLEVTQGKKMALAPEGIYSQKEGKLYLKNGVKAILEKGRAILKEETVEKLRNPEVKKLLWEKTVITAQEMSFSTKSGDAWAKGEVGVYQKGKEARSQVAAYSEAQEELILTEDVFLKKEEEWIKCEKINISIPKEAFEAQEKVEAKIKI